MKDNEMLIIFICFSLICFIIYFQFVKEQKKLIDMYSKKFGADSYEATINKLLQKPLTAPFYAFNKSFSLIYLPFKHSKDSEINLQASKVKKKIFLILIVFFTLIFVTILYALLFAGKN